MRFDVSVVVPLYNAEKFIQVCVDSVLNQTLENVEAVIVDDRSQDNSLNLCRELYGNNERVQIVQQPENKGPGAARNRGVLEARGEYIAFLDSDDEMMPDNLKLMFTAAKEHDADVLHNNHLKTMLPLDDGLIPIEMLSHPENIIIHKIDRGESTDIHALPMDLTQRLELWKKGCIHWHVGNKMVRRSFIIDNGLTFPDLRLSEDALFCLQCLLTAKNYVIMPGGWYVIRVNDASMTRAARTPKTTINAIQAQLDVVNNLRAISEKIPALRDEANFTTAVNVLLKSVEDFSVRYNFQDIGQECLRSDEDFSAFFRRNFGDEAPYVEFLFFQLHETYPKLPKLFVLDPEALEKVRRAFAEAKASGKEFIMERK